MVYELSNLNGNNFKLEVSNLSKGIYIGKVTENGKRSRVKIVSE